MEATRLNPQRVEEIFLYALPKEGEETDTLMMADGISGLVGFHPDRLEEHREEIIAMLDELPDEFKETGGGGWSFLNACLDKYGNQWTSFHQRMDQLFTLGIAIDMVAFLLPREEWPALPGSMPYLVIKK